MGYRLENTGFDIQGRQEILLFSKTPSQFFDPACLMYNGYWGSSLEVNQPGCQVDHSPLSSADVKNEWSYTHTPPLCPHDMDRKNITLICFYPTTDLMVNHSFITYNNVLK
jgi:hypothetical protein